jgi:hypothetical protein
VEGLPMIFVLLLAVMTIVPIVLACALLWPLRVK